MARDPNSFRDSVKEILARRVGYICSYPGCGQLTIGPISTPRRYQRLGDAAHISAAKPEQARYDEAMSAKQRSDECNGIWLCPTHHRMIDNDEHSYPVETLRRWKDLAEARAKSALEVRGRQYKVSFNEMHAIVEAEELEHHSHTAFRLIVEPNPIRIYDVGKARVVTGEQINGFELRCWTPTDIVVLASVSKGDEAVFRMPNRPGCRGGRYIFEARNPTGQLALSSISVLECPETPKIFLDPSSGFIEDEGNVRIFGYPPDESVSVFIWEEYQGVEIAKIHTDSSGSGAGMYKIPATVSGMSILSVGNHKVEASHALANSETTFNCLGLPGSKPITFSHGTTLGTLKDGISLRWVDGVKIGSYSCTASFGACNLNPTEVAIDRVAMVLRLPDLAYICALYARLPLSEADKMRSPFWPVLAPGEEREWLNQCFILTKTTSVECGIPIDTFPELPELPEGEQYLLCLEVSGRQGEYRHPSASLCLRIPPHGARLLLNIGTDHR